MFRRSGFLPATMKGVDFLRNRFTNKGTAFTEEERDALGIRGLVPPQVEDIGDQVDRCYAQFTNMATNINRYQMLRSCLDTNVTLFYAFLNKHMRETLPIIYTPTVGEACQKYGKLFRNDHGVYVSSMDVGNVKQILMNSRKRNIDVIVVTDGSRILGLGDLGANGMGISIGKCSLYVGGGGIHPGRVLPVMIDCGTNNETLKNDPQYLGQRIGRIADDEFYSLMDEFMAAATDVWPNAVIQFEDFSNNHCFDMLERYQKKYRCFNDDIQGTGAVVSAGFVNAMRESKVPVTEHRIVVFGAGSAAAGVVMSICDLLAVTNNLTKEDVLKMVYMVDTKGLVTNTRGDKLQKHKVPFSRTDIIAEDNAKYSNLEAVIREVKPTAFLGLGGVGPVLTEDMVKFMYSYCKRPIVFPLSNPTSKAEVSATDAYTWTEGNAIVASGSPFPETVVNGKICKPSQGNNMYIFPGIGLGASIAQPKFISNEVMVAAARKLSSMVTPEIAQNTGLLYPAIDEIRNVSKQIAVAVIQQMQKEGTATVDLPTNYPQLIKLVDKRMWNARYPSSELYLTAGPKPLAETEVTESINSK